MSHFYPLKISALHRDTRDAALITFEIPASLASEFIYQPGQHLTLRADIQGEEVRRSYSICSAVQDDALRIAIKKVSDGVFSTWATSSLEVGSVIDVMPPTGNFHLPFDASSQRRYLAVAAGRAGSRASAAAGVARAGGGVGCCCQPAARLGRVGGLPRLLAPAGEKTRRS